MISGHGTIADAVEATRAGAFDFLEKPLSRDRVLLAVKNALEQSTPAPGKRAAARTGGRRAHDDRLEPGVAARRGAGDAWRRARDARVLLIGESGTGKELLAAHIHKLEPVRRRPVREGELRRHSHRADRDRAVRPREGLLHRRHRHAARQVRAGRRRHHFPGRSGRPARRLAGQAAARAAGGRVPPRGRRADHPRERARDLGHQPRPGRAWWRRRNSAKTSTTG